MSQTGRDRPYPRGLAHVGLTVPDVDAAVEWYSETLGFEVITPPATFEPTDEHAGEMLTDLLGGFESVTLAHLSTSSGTAVEFVEFGATGDANTLDPAQAGWAHVAVVDPDVEGLATRIDDRGGDHYADVWPVFPGEEYELTYCRDPFGNRIEIYSHGDERLFSNRA